MPHALTNHGLKIEHSIPQFLAICKQYDGTEMRYDPILNHVNATAWSCYIFELP